MHIHALDHIGLHVDDLDRSLAFYRDLLGMPALERPELGFPGAWLRIGTAQELHLIGREPQHRAPPRERHFAIAVDDAEAWATRLRAAGHECRGPRPRADGAQQVFVRDPDGHVVELLQRPATRLTAR